MEINIYEKLKCLDVKNTEIANKLGLTLSAVSRRNSRGFSNYEKTSIGEIIKLTELYNEKTGSNLPTDYDKEMLEFYHKVFKDKSSAFISKGVIDFLDVGDNFFYNKSLIKKVFSEEKLDIDKIKYSWYLLLSYLYSYHSESSPGKKFRQLLKEKDINAHQLSKKLECAPSYITRLITDDENGVRSLRKMTKSTISRLAKGLNMKEIDFLNYLFKKSVDNV